MALNKFMHPRNRYRKPPDFKALAIKYPEFRKYAKQDISGKVSLNFKDLESVRALTTTLLREDFGLDVEIPVSRLIPTLPLRLNYLLWLEDLLTAAGSVKPDNITGIDIGCGASCVYPLLAAKQFGWKMIGTEVDSDSAFVASGNVKRNNLQDKITVRLVSEGTMLAGVVQPATVYDFCMCNPPFFSGVEELDPQRVARSPSRPRPRNAHSGATGELVVTGGEVAFVNDIIRDSIQLKAAIRIYSVMLGHKSSVAKVRRALHEAGVSGANVANSEFCQGRTTRWGLAWTWDGNTRLAAGNNTPASHAPPRPLTHGTQLELPALVQRLQQLMAELQITYTTLKNSQELCAMEVTAISNTWSNSRKKRRAEKMKQQQNNDKEGSQTAGALKNDINNKESEGIEKNANELNNEQATSAEAVEKESISKIEILENPDEKLTQTAENNGKDNNEDHNFKSNHERKPEDNKKKRPCGEDESSNTQPLKKSRTEGSGSEPIFIGSLVARKSDEGSTVELCWVRGSGGRDLAHQVLQYFKNNIICKK